MNRRPLVRPGLAGPAGVLLLLALACGPALEVQDRPVATIDGETLTRGELEVYFELNLATRGDDRADASTGGRGDDRAEPGADAVRSRLLDAMIDERLVLGEAARRELTIDNDLLDDLLDDPAYESGLEDRRRRRIHLRDRLLTELLQSQVLQDVVYPEEDEAVAWLADHPEASAAGRKVRIRSLRFDDPEKALEVHRSLRRNRLTFNEAVVQNSDDDSQGIETVVEWAGFPEPVRQALEELQRGWSSKPVELGAGTYLFQLVAWIDPDPQAQIEAAQEGMYSDARRAAWERFVDGLRERAKVRIVHKNLPFRYEPPEAG